MTEITLAHSELTNTIYAIIGTEKIDITEQAIAEVKALKALEQEPKTSVVMFQIKNIIFRAKEEIQAYLDMVKDSKQKIAYNACLIVIDDIINSINTMSFVKPQEPQTDILDKIREEIEEKYIGCDICNWVEEKNEDGTDISDYSQVGTIQGILQIIDKYKQTEPRTGRWIREIGYDICSECGSHTIAGRKYCPECGSYNVVEGEQND